MFSFYKNPFENIGIPIILGIVLLFATFFFGGNYDLFLTPKYQICFFITLFLFIAIFRINIKIYRFITALTTSKFYYLKLFVGFVALFLSFMALVFLLRVFDNTAIKNDTILQAFEKQSLSNYTNTAMSGLIVFAITVLFFLFKWLWKQENKLKTQKIIAGTANAKFESLKNQIDPHFLFNSLNVLSALIEENPANAQRFTTSLSKIYRYVLEQKDKELVLVQEELAFAKTYMNLLAMRFENSISFELPENFESSEAKIVPLAIQLLLENCIKHNVVSEQKPLHIKIYVKDNYLVIENNLQKKEVLKDRQSVGLQNIINRYAILTERNVLIDENKTAFAIYLPILTKQIKLMENTYSENNSYLRAKERVEKLKGFYGNLTSYCIVIPILIVINLNSENNFQWFWFPMFGWGMGLTFHALETFGFGKSWEEKKIQEILNKENNTKWN